MCCMEARLVLSGDAWVVGVPVHGDTDLKTLRKKLTTSTVDVLIPLVKNGGWAVELKQEELLVVPTSFIVVTVFKAKTFGLRWSLASDVNDTHRVISMLDKVTASYTEVNNPSTGYNQFLQYLKSI